MDLPEIEISAGEPIFEAVREIEDRCADLGIPLSGFETLNTSFPISHLTNFFQARMDGTETIIVVMTGEWTNQVMVKVLNILLEIRADPDPPGAKLRFRFYTAQPVRAILTTLFGDHRVAALECRAAMVAGFGVNLRAELCQRLAAVGIQLLSAFGIRTDFMDPAGIQAITACILQEIRAVKFPPDGVPLNTLICLGCLYGEILRSRLPYRTEWGMVKETQPWPCLLIRPRNSESPRKGSKGVRTYVFSPIARTILLSQDGSADLLEKGAAILLESCAKEFDPAPEVEAGQVPRLGA